MLIIDVSVAIGAVSLLACSLVCVAAIRSGQMRRKVRAFVLTRVVDFSPTPIGAFRLMFKLNWEFTAE